MQSQVQSQAQSQAQSQVQPQAANTGVFPPNTNPAGTDNNVPIVATDKALFSNDAIQFNPEQSRNGFATTLSNIGNPATSVTNRLTANLDDEMFRTLIEREKAYNKEVDESVGKLKDLEGNLPTRENIKDRLKKQTSLGMAQAFFEAAGSGSPDFLTSISKGFGGAAGVMNKMTGQEQKELYQHAMDEYAREQGKANTSFKRQENTLKKIQDARQFQQTVATANSTLGQRRLEMIQKGFTDNRNYLLEIDKLNADQLNDYRTFQQGAANDFGDAQATFRNVDYSSTVEPVEMDIQLASQGYAEMGVPAAQQIENRAVKTLIKDMGKFAKDVDKTLPLEQQEAQLAASLQASYLDNNRVGQMAMLQKFGPELGDLMRATGTAQQEAALIAFKRKHPWISTDYITQNTAPIYP